MAEPRRPSGKVLSLGTLHQPRLVWDHQLVPLGVHSSQEAAEAAYDAAKLLLVRKLGGEDESFEGLKLHRPATSYTSHPLWAELTGPHCSFEEACSLLAAGLAEDFLERLPAIGGKLRGRQAHAARRQRQQRQQRQAGGEGSMLSASDSETEEESGGSSSGSDGGAGGPAARAALMSDRWQGLFPADSRCYSLRLSPSLACGRGCDTTIPAPYVQAIAGTLHLPLKLRVTTPDGVQHSWPVRWYALQRQYYLCRVGGAMAALGARGGDRLCFAPTGPAAAKVWLLRELAGGDAHPGTQQQQQQQQAAAGGDSGKRLRETEHAWQPSSGSISDSEESSTEEGSSGEVSSSSGRSLEAEQLPAGRPLPGGPSHPGQKQGSRVGSSSKWSGLEPEDSGHYCMRLPLSLVPAPGKSGAGNTSIPRRYLKAITGCGDPPQQLLITTPDGRKRACSVREHGGSWYLSVGSVVTSLGAAPGDFLCFTPAGRGAAAVQLQKAPAAAAVPGTATATAAPAAGAGAPAGAPAVALTAAMAAAAEELGSDETEPGDSAGKELGGQASGLDEQEGSQGLGSNHEPPLKRRRPRPRQEGSHSTAVRASLNWSGLEEGEEDTGLYTLTLPAAAFKEGRSLKIHTPAGSVLAALCAADTYFAVTTHRGPAARYLEALFGEVPEEGQPATPIHIIAHGRQYSCSMALYNRHKGCVLLGVGLGSLMSALAVKQGDRLQLQPAGSHTARATLVKPAAAAALMPGQPAAAAGAAAAPSAASSGQGGSGHPHGGRPLHIPSPAPLPPRRPGPPTNWRGLEPADSGRYSLLLSRNVVQGERRAGMPERYAVAVFGHSPIQLNQPKLAVTVTTPHDARTHSPTLAVTKGTMLELRGLTSLLSSLGAGVGDQLCFERAGRLATNVTLVKSAAAAAAAGGTVAGPGGGAALEAESEDEEEEEEEDDAMEEEAEEEEETTQPQRSQATGAESEAGGGGGWLASRAAPQQDETAVWVEMSLLLKAAEEHGCLPAGALAAYRSKFDALPTHDWRLVHRKSLKALVDQGDWSGVENWIRRALQP